MIAWILATGTGYLLAVAMLILARLNASHAEKYLGAMRAARRERDDASGEKRLAKLYWQIQVEEVERITAERDALRVAMQRAADAHATERDALRKQLADITYQVTPPASIDGATPPAERQYAVTTPKRPRRPRATQYDTTIGEGSTQ